MKTFKEILETVEPPKSKDEQDFVDTHPIMKFKYTHKKDDVKPKKDKSRLADYQTGEDEKVYEETDLSEQIKAGKMKLNDGKTVSVSKSEAKILNDLLSSLTEKNRNTMMDILERDQKGFDEILKFAKEALD